MVLGTWTKFNASKLSDISRLTWSFRLLRPVPVKDWLVWRTDGKVVSAAAKESSSSYSPRREAKKDPRNGSLEISLLFFTLPSLPYPVYSLSSLEHIYPTIYSFLLSSFVVSPTGIHCSVANFSSLRAWASARIRKNEQRSFQQRNLPRRRNKERKR